MKTLGKFARNASGASAAEFALVLPLMLLFLFGVIDAGRYAWEFNKAEKATQVGARWAIATNMVPSGLLSYSFAVQGGIAQGTPVPESAFPGVRCSSSGGSVNCVCAPTVADACPGATGICDNAWLSVVDSTAFYDPVNGYGIVDQMQKMKGDITPDDVIIDYCNSGLGFSGDPNGPDVAPIINVRLQGMTFSPLTLMLFGGDIGLPSASYSLTMEDGQGTDAFY